MTKDKALRRQIIYSYKTKNRKFKNEMKIYASTYWTNFKLNNKRNPNKKDIDKFMLKVEKDIQKQAHILIPYNAKSGMNEFHVARYDIKKSLRRYIIAYSLYITGLRTEFFEKYPHNNFDAEKKGIKLEGKEWTEKS